MARVLLLFLLVAALTAGCAGGGTTPEGATPGGGGGPSEEETLTGTLPTGPGPQGTRGFREGALACGNFPLSVLASQYGVPAEPEAVAEAVANDFPAEDREEAERGCLSVFEDTESG